MMDEERQDKVTLVDRKDETVSNRLPDLPQASVPLGHIVGKLTQKAYSEFNNLCEVLPSMNDLDRKRSILHYATSTRQQFIKVLVLTRWAKQAQLVHTCQRAHAYIDEQDACFSKSSDDLFRLSAELNAAIEPLYDIASAIDVLTLQSCKRLPSIIQKRLVPVVFLTDQDYEEAVHKLNILLRVKLLCHEMLPLEFRKFMTLSDGIVTFKVPGEFSVTLTLQPDEHGHHQWIILDLKVLVEPKADSYEHLPCKLQQYQIKNIIDVIQRKMNSHIDETEARWPLVTLYEQLHFFCLSLQLELVFAQLNHLQKTRWNQHIKMTFDRENMYITVQYWCSQAKQSSEKHTDLGNLGHFIEMRAYSISSTTLQQRVQTDRSCGSHDEIPDQIIHSYSKSPLAHNISKDLIIKSYSVVEDINTGERVQTDTDFATGAHINTSSIDVEQILIRVTDRHKEHLLYKLKRMISRHELTQTSKDGMEKDERRSDAIRHVANKDDDEESETLKIIIDVGSISLSFTLDSRTGKFYIRQAEDGMLAPVASVTADRLALAETVLNERMDHAWSIVSFLRCSVSEMQKNSFQYAIDHVESMGSLLGLESTRRLPILDQTALPNILEIEASQMLPEFPREQTVFFKLKLFPDFALKISVAIMTPMEMKRFWKDSGSLFLLFNHSRDSAHKSEESNVICKCWLVEMSLDPKHQTYDIKSTVALDVKDLTANRQARIWWGFDFESLSKALEVSRKYVACAKIRDQFEAVDLMHGSLDANNVQFMVVRGEWFDIHRGKWTWISHTDHAQLSYLDAVFCRPTMGGRTRLSTGKGSLRGHYLMRPFGDLMLYVGHVTMVEEDILFGMTVKIPFYLKLLPPILMKESTHVMLDRANQLLVLRLGNGLKSIASLILEWQPIAMLASLAFQLKCRSSWLEKHKIHIDTYDLYSLCLVLNNTLKITITWQNGARLRASRHLASLGGRFDIVLDGSEADPLCAYNSKLQELLLSTLEEKRDIILVIDMLLKTRSFLDSLISLISATPNAKVELLKVDLFHIHLYDYELELYHISGGCFALVDAARLSDHRPAQPDVAYPSVRGEPFPGFIDAGNRKHAVGKSLIQKFKSIKSSLAPESFLLSIPRGIVFHPDLLSAAFEAIQASLASRSQVDKVLATLSSHSELKHVENNGFQLKFLSDNFLVTIQIDPTGPVEVEWVPTDAFQADPNIPALVDDYKQLSNAITKKLTSMNHIGIEEKVAFIKEFALLPRIVIRDICQVCCRLENDISNPERRLEWCLESPGPQGSLNYLPQKGQLGMKIDKPNDRVQMLLKYIQIKDGIEEERIIPFTNNYACGVLTVWKANPDEELLKTLVASPEIAQAQIESVRNDFHSKRLLPPLVDKVFLQASARAISTAHGGPGKIFACAKHLYTTAFAQLFSDDILYN